MAPRSEYLLRLDQPAMKSDNSVPAPTAKKNNRPKTATMAKMLSRLERNGCQGAGNRATAHCLRVTKSWSNRPPMNQVAFGDVAGALGLAAALALASASARALASALAFSAARRSSTSFASVG